VRLIFDQLLASYPSIQIAEHPHYSMRRCLRRPNILCSAKECLDQERRSGACFAPAPSESTLTSRHIKMTFGKTEVACTEPAWDYCRLVVRLWDKSDRTAVGMGESQFSRWGQAAQRPIGPISHRMLSNRGTAPVRRFHPDRGERVAEECGENIPICTPIPPIPPRIPPKGTAPVRRIHPARRERVAEERGLTLISCTKIPAALAAGGGGRSGTSEATPMGVPDTSATTVTNRAPNPPIIAEIHLPGALPPRDDSTPTSGSGWLRSAASLAHITALIIM